MRAKPEKLMKLSSMLLATAALAFGVNSTAWAQASSQSAAAPTTAPQKNARDPNQIVCEKIEVPGRRVATKRVCMTRAEWAEQQRQDRMDTDRAQTQRPCNGTSGC